MIRVIKSSWNIKEVGKIFSECGQREKTLLCQEDGKLNDDYFEDTTIYWLQQLAIITTDKADLVKQRLKSRWRARTRYEAEGNYGKGELKPGSGYEGTNASLRQDLHDFIDEVTAGTLASGAKGKRTKAATTDEGALYSYGLEDTLIRTDSFEHEPTPDGIRRMTAGENDTESVPVNVPPRNLRQRQRRNCVDPGVPPSEAMFIIRSAWKLPTGSDLFDILPEHSFDPATRDLADPFQDHREHMLAVYNLALVTRDRAEEAKRALADAFVGIDEFDENVAMNIIRKLAGRFKEGG